MKKLLTGGISAGALVLLTAAPAMAASGTPQEDLSAQVYLNGHLGGTTVHRGDDLKVGTNLNGTKGDSNGGKFVVTYNTDNLTYVGGKSISGAAGPCMASGNTVSCKMNIHNSSKGITFPFKVTDKANSTTVHFTGTNGYGDQATASAKVTIASQKPSPPSSSAPPTETGFSITAGCYDPESKGDQYTIKGPADAPFKVSFTTEGTPGTTNYLGNGDLTLNDDGVYHLNLNGTGNNNAHKITVKSNGKTVIDAQQFPEENKCPAGQNPGGTGGSTSPSNPSSTPPSTGNGGNGGGNGSTGSGSTGSGGGSSSGGGSGGAPSNGRNGNGGNAGGSGGNGAQAPSTIIPPSNNRGSAPTNSKAGKLGFDYHDPSRANCTAPGDIQSAVTDLTLKQYLTYYDACKKYLPASAKTGPSTGTGNAQVATVPKGAVDTGGGATAGVESPWLYGVGGALVLTGLGVGAGALRARRH
jgi:uncharacterized membrane protein YgcG